MQLFSLTLNILPWVEEKCVELQACWQFHWTNGLSSGFFSSKHVQVLFLQIKLMNTKALTHRHHATTPVWGTTLREELLPVKGVAWQAEPCKVQSCVESGQVPEPQHSSPGSHSACTQWRRSLPSCFQDLADAINPQIGVRCLNAPQVA